MSKYAADTSVPVDRSKSEIERTLSKYGADQFMYGTMSDKAIVMFRAEGRHVKFELLMPSRHERRFTQTPTGRARSETQAQAEWEQACRSSWRALALVIKAKLEAVEAGITEFEDEFLAHMMLPNGTTFGAWARPQLAAAYEQGTMPELMPGA